MITGRFEYVGKMSFSVGGAVTAKNTFFDSYGKSCRKSNLANTKLDGKYMIIDDVFESIFCICLSKKISCWVIALYFHLFLAVFHISTEGEGREKAASITTRIKNGTEGDGMSWLDLIACV